MLGRDAQDTQRLVNSWQNLAYRGDGGPDLAPGRLQQIEHESLIMLLADRAGVLVARVRVAGMVESGDALLVTEQPDAPAVEESSEISDELLAEIWRNAAALRIAGLAHGALNLSNVLATERGPMIVQFNRGRLGAPQAALNIDVAELLAATSIAASPERALDSALQAVGKDAVVAALPFIQRPAFTRHLRDLARTHELKLSALRSLAASTTHVELPRITPLRRVRLRDVAVMVLVGVAAYLIISQLEKVGFTTIWSQLRQAQWPWIVTALVLATPTFATQAVADTLAETLTQIVLLLIILPFVHLNIKLSSPSANTSTIWLILAIVAAIAIVAAAVLANPKWRLKLMPTIRGASASLRAVARTRTKRIELFGGNLATQVLFALTLGAACHAYGIHVALPALLPINMGASVFANLVAVPGGIGVAEAGLTAGLVAVEVNHSAALAAALTHRLCTYCLPPVWGYFALRWLNRHAYL